MTVSGPATSPTALQSCCAGGSPSSPQSTSRWPREAKPLSWFDSNDDRAPAWFEDFANGLLSAQKLTAALIVLHTGKGSAWEGLLTAVGETPMWETRL